VKAILPGPNGVFGQRALAAQRKPSCLKVVGAGPCAGAMVRLEMSVFCRRWEDCYDKLALRRDWCVSSPLHPSFLVQPAQPIIAARVQAHVLWLC